MAGFKETFNNPQVVLPVIHVETQRQTLQNAEIAQKEGADGVFLISMKGMPHSKLARVHENLRNEVGDLWIGVNYLDLTAEATFSHLKGIPGVWIDNAQIDEKNPIQLNAHQIEESRKRSRWKGLYFGGVAFKYQRTVEDLEKAAQIAMRYVDVVTTSGEGTGSAPDIAKIKRMKAALQEAPLAVASGISPENVHNYLEDVDCFLVATQILVPGREEFDPSRMRDLIQIVRSSPKNS